MGPGGFLARLVDEFLHRPLPVMLVIAHDVDHRLGECVERPLNTTQTDADVPGEYVKIGIHRPQIPDLAPTLEFEVEITENVDAHALLRKFDNPIGLGWLAYS